MSRGGFYAWLRKPLSDRAREDQRLLGLIVAAYTARIGVDGAQRIFLDLREAGEIGSERRVARIMRVRHFKAFRGHCALRYARAVPALLTIQYPVMRFYRSTPEPNLGYGYPLRAHMGRLVLSGVVYQPVLPQHCRLAHRSHATSEPCAGRASHGYVTTQSPARPDSIRSRVLIWSRCVVAFLSDASLGTQHELE